MHPLTTTEDAEARMARAAAYPDLSPQTLTARLAAWQAAHGPDRRWRRAEAWDAVRAERRRIAEGRAALLAATRRTMERSAA